MNKNVMYVAVFGVLCVLVGVLAGAGIVRNTRFPWPGPDRPDFAERAGHFMDIRLEGPGRMGGAGPVEMLTVKLGLSAEQRIKVMEILENTRRQIDSIGKKVRNAIIEIKENGDKQIMGILTPLQQEKFKALQDRFKKGHRPDRPRGERWEMER